MIHVRTVGSRPLGESTIVPSRARSGPRRPTLSSPSVGICCEASIAVAVPLRIRYLATANPRAGAASLPRPAHTNDPGVVSPSR